ncbi:class I SAM-dependent methyltransferase [Mesorhizobium sp. LHD-90]|uniref:class I SAM-dependent methyltransferase n=1 Tax=Mesorhizobium sp. LHD-90 TaxID=3071414 RepID=UPI0027DEE813|nr:class I SAM-dependent methyltransferase [Mesorhizobium sp. LHD-90]MDQ6436182.1 class I SAM-dependent methyltransferase [Mesorhizobium sp. LHD-90]
MSRETPAVLFHPFVSGELPVPDASKRVLFLGAEPGFRLPEGFAARLSLVQGFRPSFRTLEKAGYDVSPVPEGENYDAALVLCGRHRGENEIRLAEAVARTNPGGLIVVAGGKDDGVASLRKRVGALVQIDGHLPKSHGVVFWLRRPAEPGSALAGLRAEAETGLVEGRFKTAPGMFSHDRVDPGSKLLAANLPADLAGHLADFCAGWGYLAAEVAARCEKVRSIDLYEADHASLEATRRNLADSSVPLRFFWHDLADEPVKERYDAIVMNPPFHTGRQAEPSLGQAIIKAAAGALKPGGRLLLVANRQLPYERTISEHFSSLAEIAGDNRFKVIAARR